MKNLIQLQKEQSVKTIKKNELKKVKGGKVEDYIGQPDIYDL